MIYQEELINNIYNKLYTIDKLWNTDIYAKHLNIEIEIDGNDKMEIINIYINNFGIINISITYVDIVNAYDNFKFFEFINYCKKEYDTYILLQILKELDNYLII